MLRIETQSDFEQLINSDDIVIVNVYRGSWCPFCKKYLSKFDRAFEELAKGSFSLYGVSVDLERTNSKLKESLSLSFPLITDAGQIFRSSLKNPVSTSHPNVKKTVDGYFLQPAVYIYQQGELKYQWQQTSKLLNLAGAIGRVEVEDIVHEAKKLID
jgi:peroxiredoxin